MRFPEDLRYTDTHEWIRSEDGRLRVGISDHAQSELGELVYVDLPEVGRQVEAGETVAEVESTKSVGEVYAPAAGTVVAVNEALEDDPELVNRDPYGEGWILLLEPVGEVDLAAFLDAAGYRATLD